jgi:O-antigen/teichoic acid export membrane protein
VTRSHWQKPHEHPLYTLARNVSTRYLLIVTNVLIGLVMLRFNIQHLGAETYGLWMLAASVTAYFTVLDFGYGSAVVRYVAQFRARGDVRALNETLSTMAVVFAGLGVLCVTVAVVLAVLLPSVFNVTPAQVQPGRVVLLLIGLQVGLYFPFGIFGGVINGFEQYYVNNIVGLVANVTIAIVNVTVLSMGYGLVELVACSTLLRIAPLWVYRWNAYRVFPALEIRWRSFRRERLRELSGFSIYVAVSDWATRLTYATDAFFIGIFLNTVAMAVYAIAQRITDTLLTLTQQLHTFMMPAIVHRAVEGEIVRQRSLLVRATRFQLALALCLCGTVAALAGTLIETWLGPGWEDSALVTQLLAGVVVLRAAVAMPATVLQGTGEHKRVAVFSVCGAVANLILSVLFVRSWGIVGLAAATLTASALSAMLIFPRSCRAVGLSVASGCQTIVIPALWPALVATSWVLWVQSQVRDGVVSTLLILLGGGVIYTVLFLAFGIDRDERRWFRLLWQRLRPAQRLAARDVVGLP